ncbi:Ig-like domain-containing protein [Streptomyces polyrhachis]|uniref:Ig-like domain-containing protein n=1 Tax=Streptomyces polyrhachis TaxID=1282885 RepID=A0ABW2GIQ0_9ACTN
MRRGSGRRRRASIIALLGSLLGLGGAGCTGGGDGQEIRVTPGAGAVNVREDARLRVAVLDGRLERVRVVRTADGESTPVAGAIAGDGLSWRPSAGRLAVASSYTVHAVALDGHGRRHSRQTTFSTRAPAGRFVAHFSPEHRSTAGVGTIVSLVFSRPVADRAAVERAVTVTARPPVEVAAHWFGDGRLDLRPRAFWRPGTAVTVALRLKGVHGGGGYYGIQDKKLEFTIGRSVISTVDARAKTIEVRRDGRLLRTLPVSAGAAATPTYSGYMVVMERLRTTRMNGQTVGFAGEYDISDVPHAVRLTRSGTFLHGNYWTPRSAFGSVNASHGCVGLPDEKGGSPASPAGWFFRNTLPGDLVRVVNSPQKTVGSDNGYGGWNLPWPRWRAGSALRS